MSTTIKRIALVAVAALSLGVVSVAPSHAANSVLAFGTGDSAGADNTTGYGVAGAFNYITVNVTSAAADYVLTTDSTFLGQGDASPVGTLSADSKSLSMTDTGVTGIRVATPSVGTVTVKYWVRTGGVLASTAAESVVVTVNASAQSGVFSAAKSTVYVASGETSTAVTADATVNKVATADSTNAAATVQVTLADALAAAYNDTVTATIISGGGVISGSDSSTVSASGWDATANQYTKSVRTVGGKAYFTVFANGQAGVTTIVVKLNDGTTLATKTVTFSSTTVASISATVKKNFVLASTSATTGVFAVTLKDAAGNAIQNSGTVSATPASGTTVGGAGSCSWDSTDLVYYCQVQGLAADKFGVVEYTFSHSSAPSASVNAKASVTFSSKVAASFVIADTTANAGGDVIYTITAKDANGYAVPDGSAVGNYVSSVTTTGGIVKEIDTTTATSTAGVFTVKGTAPLVSTTLTSTFNLSGTAGAASTYFAAALAGTTPKASAVVSNAASDAAIDAANEATAAANDATDAALAAADAADAATTAAQNAVDAVQELSDKVDALIKGLKAQITALTNLVIKIQKKVKA